MKLGRLLIAAILLAGLGGALWWSDKSEKAKEGKPAADAPPKIITIAEGDLKQIEVKRREGEDTIVKKNDAGNWEITAPKPMPADASSISALTSAVAGFTSERVL